MSKRLDELKKHVFDFFKPAFENYGGIDSLSFFVGFRDHTVNQLDINESDIYINEKHVDQYGDKDIYKYYCSLLDTKRKIPASLNKEKESFDDLIEKAYDSFLNSDPYCSFLDFFAKNFVTRIDDPEDKEVHKICELLRSIFAKELKAIYKDINVKIYNNGEVHFYIELSYRSVCI